MDTRADLQHAQNSRICPTVKPNSKKCAFFTCLPKILQAIEASTAFWKPPSHLSKWQFGAILTHILGDMAVFGEALSNLPVERMAGFVLSLEPLQVNRVHLQEQMPRILAVRALFAGIKGTLRYELLVSLTFLDFFVGIHNLDLRKE